MKVSLLFFLSITSFFASFSQIKLDSGLVAYYPFNGNANDESGNGNDALFNNATLTTDRAGKPNSAYSFNGVDNYMRIATSTSINPLNQISVCAFVKPTGFFKGPCHGNSILMKGDADYLPGNYLLRFDDNAYTFQNNCNTSIVDTIHQNFYSLAAQTPSPGYSPYINKNQWYCLAFTYDGVSAKFYVDGMLTQTQVAAGITFSNQYDLFLGKLNNPSYSYWFNGSMDEVRIYNRAIDSQEVAALCPSAALPVTITKFKASIVNRQIKLDWDAENEEGIIDYTIERSTTGSSDFIKIGTVTARKLRSYSFIDNSAGINQDYYYRLAIRENANAIIYSDIRKAKIAGSDKFVIIYPNPSKGKIEVKINGYNGESKLTIINSNGQTIMHKELKVFDNAFTELNLNKQPAGVYYLDVETLHDNYIQKIILF